MRGLNQIEALWLDIRYGLRLLKRKPAFTAVMVLTLALGIGANTAIFSIVDAVVFRPLPFHDPSRVVAIWESETQQLAQPKMFTSYRDLQQWQAQNHTFEKLAGYTWVRGGRILTGVGEPQDVLEIPVTQDFFSLLGIVPVLGRTFGPDDLKSGNAVVLSHRMWQTVFGGARDIVGRQITLDDRPYFVTGVMPAEFEMYPAQTGLWSLLTSDDDLIKSPKQHNLAVVGRVKSGVSRASASEDLALIRRRVNEQDSDSFKNVGVVLNGLQNEYTWLAGRNLRSGLLILLGAIAFVLLIACVNVANLQLARASERRREMAIRAALGSGRRRLIRQLLTESMLISGLGALLGVILAKFLVGYFVAARPIELPPGNAVKLNARVLAFTVCVAVVTGLLSGVLPAWQGTRLDLNLSLKESSRGSSSGALSHRSGRFLVIVEVALALILLIGAGLMIESVIHLQREPLGFHADHLITTRLPLPRKTYARPEQQIAFYTQLLDRLHVLPGVQGATMTSAIPLAGGGGNDAIVVEGQPVPLPNEYVFDVEFHSVQPDYFKVLGIPVLRGRTFEMRDGPNTEAVAIVDQALVNRYFAGEDPIGKHIRVGGTAEKSPWLTIIGVVGNLQYRDVFREMGWAEPPIVFRPYLQAPAAGRGSSMGILVRTVGDPRAMASAVRQEIRGLDSALVVRELKTMDEIAADFQSQPRFRAILVGAFASLALLLAALGIYGVLSQGVLQRTQEIGIRMALGATPRDVLRMVIRQGLRLVLIGMAVGLAGAFAVTRVLSSLLFGVKPTDPSTFILISLVLITVALMACYIPARRALSVDPAIALRCD